LKKVIVLGGPTATGKTELAVELALMVNGEVVTADSAQVYRYMNIGTAKPTLEERRGIPHHMIDVVNPDEEFSVAQYKAMAEDAIRNILSRGKVPIVVGGTGLYISSLVYNIRFSDTMSDWGFRERMKALAEQHGPEYLHERLKEIDPDSAGRIHPNNVKRVIRALEVFETTGRTMTEHQAESRKEQPEFDYQLFGLIMDRQKLYERIGRRTDLMMENGLADEVAGLLKMGYSRDLVSMQALGYKELAAAISGECTMEEAVEKIKLGTRHLAKRQITWFRSMDDLKWLDTQALDRRAMLKILADSLNNSI